MGDYGITNPNLIALTILISILISIFFKWKNNPLSKVPGFRDLFLLGHVRLVTLKSPLADVHRQAYFQELLSGMCHLYRKKGFYKLKLFFKDYVIVFAPSTVGAITSSRTELYKGQVYHTPSKAYGDGIFTSNGGDKWKKERKLLNPSFSSAVLNSVYLPIMNHHAQELLITLAKNASKDYVNIMDMVEEVAFGTILESALGTLENVTPQERYNYMKNISIVEQAMVERPLRPWWNSDLVFNRTAYGKKFLISANATRSFVAKVVKKRKEILSDILDEYNDEDKKIKSFMDIVLAEQREHNSFTEVDLVDHINTIVGGGFGTVAVTSSWALFLLGLYPEIQEKVYQEIESIFGEDDEREVTVDDVSFMKYMTNVLKETMRIYPTVPLIARELQQDINIDGINIPKDTTVVMYIWGLHHNPEIYPDPEVFDPDRMRPDKAFIPFSEGPRNCIGKSFAMLEMKVILSTVLRKYRIQSLEHRDSLVFIPLVTGRAHKEINVKLLPRKT